MTRSVLLSITTFAQAALSASVRIESHARMSLTSKLEPLHLRVGLCKADARQYRHRKYACRDARVIRRMLCAVDDVPANDPTFIGRDRGKFRGFGNGVAADIDRRVRRRAQVRVERDLPAFRLDLTGGKVEAIDIRDASRSVDHPLGLDCAFRSALLIDDAEPVRCPLDPPKLGPVWIATPIRSVLPRSCATASASRLSSSLGNALAQRIVRGDHQPGAGKRESARH